MILKPALPAIAPDQSKNYGALDAGHRFPKFVPYGYMYSMDGWTVESDFTKVNGKYYLAFFHADDAIPTVLDFQITSNPSDVDCLVSDGTYWLLTYGKLVKATYKEVGLHLADIVGISPTVYTAGAIYTLAGDASKAMLYMNNLARIVRRDMDLTGTIGETHIRNQLSFDPTPPIGFDCDLDNPYYLTGNLDLAWRFYPDDITITHHVMLKEARGGSKDFGNILTTSGYYDLDWPERVALFGADLPYDFWIDVDGVQSNHRYVTSFENDDPPTTVPVLYTGTVRRITPLGLLTPTRMIAYEERSDCVDFEVVTSIYLSSEVGGYFPIFGDGHAETSTVSIRYLEVDVADLISNPVVIEDGLTESDGDIYADCLGDFFAYTPYNGGSPVIHHKKEDGTWEQITVTVPTGYTAPWPLSFQYGHTWLYQLATGDPSFVFAVYKTDGSDAVGGSQFYRLATMSLPDGVVTVDSTTYKVRESYYGQVGGIWGYWPTDPAVYHDVGPMTGATVAISKDGKHTWYNGIYRDNTLYVSFDDYTLCRTVVLAQSNAVWYMGI